MTRFVKTQIFLEGADVKVTLRLHKQLHVAYCAIRKIPSISGIPSDIKIDFLANHIISVGSHPSDTNVFSMIIRVAHFLFMIMVWLLLLYLVCIYIACIAV